MSFTCDQQLLSPAALKKELFLDDKTKSWIEFSRKEIKNTLSSTEKSRFIVICGPCSLHEKIAFLDYAKKIKTLFAKLPHFLLILRCFCEKPRTHLGWKGFVYDPHLDGSFDMAFGLYETRKLMLELAKLEIPIACELLDPNLSSYFEDLLSFGFIGSRTSSSQIHRQLASKQNFPIGFKNPASGELLPAVLSCHSATQPHTFFSLNEEGTFAKTSSSGNPYTHLVLRGSHVQTNYDEKSLESALALMQKFPPLIPKIFVDCSHGNAQGDFLAQKKVFASVLKHKKNYIAGVLLESFLQPGNQGLTHPLKYGYSITDGCLGFEETEKLLSTEYF